MTEWNEGDSEAGTRNREGQHAATGSSQARPRSGRGAQRSLGLTGGRGVLQDHVS